MIGDQLCSLGRQARKTLLGILFLVNGCDVSSLAETRMYQKKICYDVSGLVETRMYLDVGSF